MKNKRFVAFLIGICFLLGGCRSGGFGAEYTAREAEYNLALPAGEVNLSYEVPQAVPNVVVDRFGYEPESGKTAVFKGKQMPSSFTVRNAETGNIVYTGAVKTKGNGKSETEYYYYGDFSDVKQPGNYYIQIDTYGESYPFLIHDNLYYSLYKRSFDRLHTMRDGAGNAEEGWQMEEKGENREIAACVSLYQLLLSYEMFPSVCTDDMGIPESGNGTADLLDECRYEIEWLIRQAQISPGGSGISCAYRAAVLAKYAYLTKNADGAFYGECLRAAETAWKGIPAEDPAPDDLRALAAAELYRLTGGRQYLAFAEEYLETCVERTGKLSGLAFWSGVTYLNTKNKVEVELCDALIKKIMEEAEEIARQSKEDSFFVCSGRETEDGDALLQEMMRIGIVNHIITNHEYNTVIENYVHYLLGRNENSVCYVSWWEGQELPGKDLMEDPVKNTAFLFVLSGLLGNG